MGDHDATAPTSRDDAAASDAGTDCIQVFLGTKAQYIKTAPLLRLMDQRGVPYRLIDSGQHAALSVGLRKDLDVRAPDTILGGTKDITSIPQALGWMARLSTNLVDRDRLRHEVFGGRGGICVVHGDTPSTLLSTLMARTAGLRVAHLEAGLRSHKLLHPFPEELIRIVVMRRADLLFAPDAVAVRNLERLKAAGRVVPLSANTVVEALAHDLRGAGEPASGPAIVTMHRVENLKRSQRVAGLVELVTGLASDPSASDRIRFVVHGPTEEVLSRRGDVRRLEQAGVEIVRLAPHREFVAMLHQAPFVITDGGSIQEECALLGVPTLLWRDRSERPDGIGDNVVVSHYDPGIAASFLADPARYRTAPAELDLTPSRQILEVLLAEL